jgi:hypothetical protein
MSYKEFAAVQNTVQDTAAKKNTYGKSEVTPAANQSTVQPEKKSVEVKPAPKS